MKRALRYGLGMGLGAAAGMAIARRFGPPVLGDKPRRSRTPGTPPEGPVPARMGRVRELLRRAVDEGRRVMKETEEELARQVASAGDESP